MAVAVMAVGGIGEAGAGVAGIPVDVGPIRVEGVGGVGASFCPHATMTTARPTAI